MNDKVPIENSDILQMFREELRQYLDEIVALNWRTENNRFVLELCGENRQQFNVDIAIDAEHTALPVFSGSPGLCLNPLPRMPGNPCRSRRHAGAGHH